RHETRAHAFDVLGRVYGMQAVRDVTVTVLEITEHAIPGNAFLDFPREIRAECTIPGRAGLFQALEQKRQIGKLDLRHPIGHIARRLIRERQYAVLRHPQEIAALVAEVHHVPDVLHVHGFAELRFELVAHDLERPTARRIGRPVAAHANLYRFAHTRLLFVLKTIIAGKQRVISKYA